MSWGWGWGGKICVSESYMPVFGFTYTHHIYVLFVQAVWFGSWGEWQGVCTASSRQYSSEW